MSFEEKSHVGMAHKLCPVCHKKHDEVVLINKRLQKTLKRDMMAGYDLCPEHKADAAEYITLIELTGNPNTDKGIQFTGNTVKVRRTAAPQIFNVPFSADQNWSFIEPGVIDKLKALMPKEEGNGLQGTAQASDGHPGDGGNTGTGEAHG